LSNLAISNEVLSSKLVRYLLDADLSIKEGRDGNSELEEFLNSLRQEAGSSLLVNYICLLMSNEGIRAMDSEIERRPVEFIKAVVDFTFESINSKKLSSDKYKKQLALKFFERVLNDLRVRPAALVMNKEQVAKMESILRGANSYSSVNFPGLDQILSNTKTKSWRQVVTSVVAEGLSSASTAEDNRNIKIEYLLALDALASRLRDHNPWAHLELGQLLPVIEWMSQLADTPISSDSLTKKVSPDFFSQNTLKHCLSSGLASAILRGQIGQVSASQMQEIRLLMGEVGVRKGTLEFSALELIALDLPTEPKHFEWWRALSLSELVEICLEKPVLRDGMTAAAKEGAWFNKVIESHLADASDLRDLVVAISANSIFQRPSSEYLKKIWKIAAEKSQILQDIEDELVLDPVESERRLAEAALNEARERHRADMDELNERLFQVKEDASKLKAALESRGQSVSEARVDVELGVAKKYGEALARLIRRLERDSSKSSLKEILEREAAGLKRLDIQLLPAGEESNFDPSIHDSAGLQIALGGKVETLESGALLTIGDKTITLMKAVVKPSS